MRVLRIKPWNPNKRQLVKTWVHNGVHYKAGVDIGFPGETPSTLYKFENDNDPVIDYLLKVRHHNTPDVLAFEEVIIGKKDKDLEKVIQDDMEARIADGGMHKRARVEDVQFGDNGEQPKRRQRPSNAKGRTRPKQKRSMSTDE